MPSKKPSKPKGSLVFVPSKPWSTRERRRKISISGGRIEASLFEHLLQPEKRRQGRAKERDRRSRKKGRAIDKFPLVLGELRENKTIPAELKNFVTTYAEKQPPPLTKAFIKKQISNITGCMNRDKMSPQLFSFLEALRLALIDAVNPPKR